MTELDCTCVGASQFEGTWCGPYTDGKNHRIDCPRGRAAREEQDRVLRAARQQPTKAAPPDTDDRELADQREACDLYLENRAPVVDFDAITHKRLLRLEGLVAKISTALAETKLPPAPPPTAGTRRAFSASVYLRCGTRILLVLHKRFNLWVPLGGEREGDETPLETAQRELCEEAGAKASFPVTSDIEGTPRGFLCYEEHDAASRGLHMNFAFVAITDSTNVLACDEHQDRRWFTYSEIETLESVGKTPLNVRRIAKLALDSKL
jgi:8-oxo-dGTP pyrophosphatase MutT (NUDIX family)